jgi:hypothetical protein
MYMAAHPMLRRVNTICVMPYGVADLYDQRFFELYKYKPAMDNYGRQFLMASQGKCQIVRSPYTGGDRVYITIPGNYHFGMDSLSDQDFVQIRSIDADPNIVQFWIQAGYGTRIASFNKKVFIVNDQADASTTMSGDS